MALPWLKHLWYCMQFRAPLFDYLRESLRKNCTRREIWKHRAGTGLPRVNITNFTVSSVVWDGISLG